MTEKNWYANYDVVVVGSGAGALVAAIEAGKKGLKTLIVEKGKQWGGSSALSGGGIWVPNNPVCKAAGLKDSFEEGMKYFESCVGDVGPASSYERRVAFLTNGPKMVQMMLDEGVKFLPGTEYPDYYPELPGGKIGRSFDCYPFDTKLIGELGTCISNLGEMPFPMSTGACHHIPKAFTKPRHLFGVANMVGRGVKLKLKGQKAVGLGNALVGNLMYIAKKYNVEVWLGTPCTDILVDDNQVIGIEVVKDGKKVFLKTNNIILGAGGFDHNVEMRKKYHGIGNDWTMGHPNNTGDLHVICEKLDAEMAIMDDAWWGAGAFDDKNARAFYVWERSMPHCIIVDQLGQRYLNESESYNDFGQHMFQQNEKTGKKAIPSWLIMDTNYLNKYPFGAAMPHMLPKSFLESGYFIKCNSIEELAKKCCIQKDNLLDTIEHFNGMVDKGEDKGFGRGNSAYDNYYGDPRYKNPNLGKLEKGPFYAIKIHPTDLGTKGGMLTDEHARVIKKDGSIIEGLYATGNCSASIMGYKYPGPGATLGASATFGYIAGNHVAANKREKKEKVI